ncbi:MAG TPA: DUF5658 family protein [Thermodesulfobacteriota bacterium]|nr:DUF5658 family protein [Thermodesulfobacteriota bacterium]
MREFEKRIHTDRREHSTRCLSRYTFSGQRRMLRREVDQKKGCYVDRYDLKLFLILILIAVLNTFDSVFTKAILHRGGLELNPIVHVSYDLWGDSIWTWKIVAMPCLLFFLYFHSKFKRVEIGIVGMSYLYTAVALYQAFQYQSIAH